MTLQEFKALADIAWDYFSMEEQYQLDRKLAHGTQFDKWLSDDRNVLIKAEEEQDIKSLQMILNKYQQLHELGSKKGSTLKNNNRKFAAFNAPQKGDRIEVPNRPGQYYLISNKPESGKDPRGQPFWQARGKDQEGREQMLSSDNVPSWNHFKGKNYQWHDDDLEKGKWDKQQKEQSSLIQEFESKFIFPDGQPLKTNPGRKMMVSVLPNAGSLAVFAGENLFIKSIDYKNMTVELTPVADGLDEFKPDLMAIPANEVVSDTKPAMRPEIMMESVSLPNGNKITAGELIQMTPILNSLARNGQIEPVVRVEPGYQSKGMNGEQHFIRDMELRGIDPESVKSETGYYLSPREVKFDPKTGRPLIFAAWAGDLRISPPISDEALKEIKTICPENHIWPMRGDGIRVQSNALYKQMISLGLRKKQPEIGSQQPQTRPSPISEPAALAWVKMNCKFANQTLKLEIL